MATHAQQPWSIVQNREGVMPAASPFNPFSPLLASESLPEPLPSSSQNLRQLSGLEATELGAIDNITSLDPAAGLAHIPCMCNSS